MFSRITYSPKPEDDPLKALIKSARAALANNRVEIAYPRQLRAKGNHSYWEELVAELDRINSDVLSSIANRGGVYGIWTTQGENQWHLKYIGQAKGSLIRQRIRNHLIWRNKQTTSGKYTGSKFDEVQSALASKHDISLTFVEISPESLRHYVEEVILNRSNPEWNLHGTTAKGQKLSRIRCSV